MRHIVHSFLWCKRDESEPAHSNNTDTDTVPDIDDKSHL